MRNSAPHGVLLNLRGFSSKDEGVPGALLRLINLIMVEPFGIAHRVEMRR